MDTTITQQELETFKAKVNLWLSLTDDIKKLTLALKELKEKKTALTPEIEKFMNSYEINDAKTQKGTVKLVSSWSKEGMNKKTLTDKIGQYLQNIKLAEEAITWAYDNRTKVEKTRLKIITPKKPKQK